MAIVSCPECQKKLKVKDESVGKKVKCSCGNVFVATEDAAPAAPPPSDKVMVACTECGANLKVASTSLGKKMKCPKCAGVFTAALVEAAPAKKGPPPPAEEEDVPVPPKKMSKKDEDDLFSFGQEDAEKSGSDVFTDDEEEVTPKGKAKKKVEDDDEEDLPRPKPKGASPPAVPDDEDEKPVYPSRILANIFVTLLLLAYAAVFVVVFLGFVETGMPKVDRQKPVMRKFGAVDDEEDKKEAAKLVGAWTIESVEASGKARDDLKGQKFIFEATKVTTPDWQDVPFTVDSKKDPKEMDIAPVDKVPLRAIYKLDGDTLQLCTNVIVKVPFGGKDVDSPSNRPTKFDSKEGVLYVLKREAKKDDGKGKDEGKDKTKDDGKDKDKGKDESGKGKDKIKTKDENGKDKDADKDKTKTKDENGKDKDADKVKDKKIGDKDGEKKKNGDDKDKKDGDKKDADLNKKDAAFDYSVNVILARWRSREPAVLASPRSFF